MSEAKCHHEWIDDTQLCEPRAFMCTQCGERCPGCNVCGGPTNSSLLTCQRCLDHCAEVLDGIGEALEHYQPSPTSPVKAIRYDQDKRGGNSDHVPLDVSDGPGDIEAVLLDWVAMWAEKSGAQNLAPVDYLRGRLVWASNHAEDSAWDDFRREMRMLRHRARRLAGLLPQRQAGTCIYCGGDVVRDWADEHWRPRADGLSDEVRCTRCRETWENRERWQFANRHTILALPQTHPELLVTRDEARMIFPEVPHPTWRSWVHRDAKRGQALLEYREYVATGRIGPEPEPERMPVQSWDQRGQALYRLADLTALVEERADDTRVRRKAG